MLVSVCYLWAVDLDTEWLYGEHLRHSSMDQEAKNTVELCLTNAWHREEDTFDTFRLEGFDLCETCFIQLYGINQSCWKTEKSSFARASGGGSMLLLRLPEMVINFLPVGHTHVR